MPFPADIASSGNVENGLEGAALSPGSSIGLQQAAPEGDPWRSFYSERFVRRESIKAQLETGWGRSVTEYGGLRGGFREPPAANR
jgi:hypothetical protein